MERMNRLAGELEQAAENREGKEKQAADLRTLTELELVLAGGGDHGVEWP